MRTKKSEGPMLRLVGAGKENNGSVSTIYGLERVAGTTVHKTQSQVPSELLSELERQVEILESKYLKVCDTLITVTEHLVKLSAITSSTVTIKDN